jgi:hypothetical protein
MQKHNKFKTFIIDGHNHENGKTFIPIAAFLQEGKVAPKSIGVEYLEGKDKTVLTLGYRDDEQGQMANVSLVNLGQLDLVPGAIEEAFGKAASGVENVICHEFFVTGDGTFFAVFLTAG